MANETLKAQMVIPEVMKEMIAAKIAARNKIRRYAKVDNTLKGVPGDQVTVPSWNFIGNAVDVNEGATVGLTQMSAGKTSFGIKKAMKAASLSHEALISGYGKPREAVESQLAKAIDGKVDDDILAAALTATMVYVDSAHQISYAGIVNAVMKFEDEEDGIDKVMFIHPLQEGTLIQDSSFLSADKYEKGVAVNGAVGKIAGCWIKKSNKIKHADGVQGSRTVTIDGTLVKNDIFKITIGNKEYSFKDTDDSPTATTVATGLVAAITADTDAKVSASNSSGVITISEKTGYYGIALKEAPALATTSSAGTITLGGTYSGTALFEDVIIKLEPDSNETEYAEDEFPALTLFVKEDVEFGYEFKHLSQMHEFSVAMYYGVALTNDAKVVRAKFLA